jgi:hypothetical protein
VHSNGLDPAFLDEEHAAALKANGLTAYVGPPRGYVLTFSNELVKPASVIASHANEEATKDGKLLAGTKTETFKKAVKVPVHLPLSGRTMAFDGKGTCVSGC